MRKSDLPGEFSNFLFEGLTILSLLCSPLPALALEAVTAAEDGTPVVHFTSGKRCKEGLPVGGRRQAQYDTQNSPTGVHTFYTLTRESEKVYTADLKIKFVNGGYDGADRPRIGAEGVDQHAVVDGIFRKKMRACYEEYRGKIKDARGNAINFNLSESADDNSRFSPDAKPFQIAIRGSRQRSNSKEYNSQIDCPTMIHETMHILGLCDEYKESHTQLVSDDKARKMGFKGSQALAYDCRKIGPENSLMNDQNKALEPLQEKPPAQQVTYLYCDCGGSKTCEWGGIKQGTSCPEGAKALETKTIPADPGTLQSLERGVYGRSAMIVYSETAEAAAAPSGDIPPVLSNEQMDVVLYPNCRAVNGDYYDCATDAYKTTLERGGEGCQAPASCRAGNPR